MAPSQLSPRGAAILLSLREVLHALDEHPSQPERQLLYEMLAAHLRSAHPMAMIPEVVR